MIEERNHLTQIYYYCTSMIKIFIDFDGTITTRDVGDAMFISFGGDICREYIRKYRAGDLTAEECFNLECRSCNGISKTDLDLFLDSQSIDSTFIDFHRYCKEQEIPHFILSDGMDYYIKRILENNGIADIPFFTNHLEVISLGYERGILLEPSFPFLDENCDRCACCKRNHMLAQTADDDIIVYIGEGFSDRCPVRYADIVFAKDELLTYCQQENISYFEYRTFSDVKARLQMLVSKKQSKKNYGLHKRRQAQLATRDVYLGG